MKLLRKIVNKTNSLKKEIKVVSLALSEKKTPLPAKILIFLTIGYFLSPIDLIPDFIPVLGYLDDLIILPLLIAFTIKIIPVNILDDCRHKVNDSIMLNKKFGYIFSAFIVIIWTIIIVLVVIN